MKSYIIKKVNTEPSAEDWINANIAYLDVQPCSKYPCHYETKAQLLYTNEALYVHFYTTETKLRVQNTERNSNVYEDSCIEFFFSPDENDNRYFNFEINAIGTILLFVCNGRGNYEKFLFDEEMFDIKTIITKNGWELFYKIPFSFILEHFDVISKNFKGNFYKCGNKTAERHYACWNEINLPEPELHCPKFFGKLIFE